MPSQYINKLVLGFMFWVNHRAQPIKKQQLNNIGSHRKLTTTIHFEKQNKQPSPNPFLMHTLEILILIIWLISTEHDFDINWRTT